MNATLGYTKEASDVVRGAMTYYSSSEKDSTTPARGSDAYNKRAEEIVETLSALGFSLQDVMDLHALTLFPWQVYQFMAVRRNQVATLVGYASKTPEIPDSEYKDMLARLEKMAAAYFQARDVLSDPKNAYALDVTNFAAVMAVGRMVSKRAVIRGVEYVQDPDPGKMEFARFHSPPREVLIHRPGQIATGDLLATELITMDFSGYSDNPSSGIEFIAKVAKRLAARYASLMSVHKNKIPAEVRKAMGLGAVFVVGAVVIGAVIAAVALALGLGATMSEGSLAAVFAPGAAEIKARKEYIESLTQAGVPPEKIGEFAGPGLGGAVGLGTWFWLAAGVLGTIGVGYWLWPKGDS